MRITRPLPDSILRRALILNYMHNRPNTQTAVLSTTFPFWVESDNEEETPSDAEESAEAQAFWEDFSFPVHPVWSMTPPARVGSYSEEETSSDAEGSSSSQTSSEDSSSPAQPRVGEKRKRGEYSSPRLTKRFILPAFLTAELSCKSTQNEWFSEADSDSEDESSKEYEDWEESQELEDAGTTGYKDSEGNENSEGNDSGEYEDSEENQNLEDAGPTGYKSSGDDENSEDDSQYDSQETSPPLKKRAVSRAGVSTDGEDSKKYWCLKCGEDFRTSGGIKRHMESKIHMEPRYLCDICKKKYQRHDVLQKHMSKLHGVRI